MPRSTPGMTCAAVRHATAKPSHDGRAGKLSLRSARETRRRRRRARDRTCPCGGVGPPDKKSRARTKRVECWVCAPRRLARRPPSGPLPIPQPNALRSRGRRASAVHERRPLRLVKILLTVTVPATRLRPPENRGPILSIIGAILPLDAETPHDGTIRVHGADPRARLNISAQS
jgi:hypothetical protein